MLATEDQALQLADGRWRIAFENSVIGITMADFTGRFFAVNSAFATMLGYQEPELYQLTFMDITYEEDRKVNLELVRDLAEGKRKHFQIEKRYRRKDRSLVWVRTSVALVPGMGAVAPFWFGIVENITRRKEVEEALQMTHAELVRVSRATSMGELAATIAHEINQPLTAINNNSSACLRLLADGNLEPGILVRALEEIVADSTRASNVIARIRSFMKKAPSERNELEANDVIQEVLALKERDFSENQVLVGRELANDLPRVLGDRVQLQQVLLNLFVNAVEALASVTDRPRSLWVQSRVDESGDVLIAVHDSGTGLGVDADRIFGPFFTTKADGMGMGLSISRSIIEAHGGRLWAEPNSPTGTVFYFTLPVVTGSSS